MVQKKTAVVSGSELRVQIPKVLLDEFQKNPRIVIKTHPAGIYPIDPGILKNGEALKKILSDREFQENFELVAVCKNMP